jgi:hypothetical protein
MRNIGKHPQQQGVHVLSCLSSGVVRARQLDGQWLPKELKTQHNASCCHMTSCCCCCCCLISQAWPQQHPLVQQLDAEVAAKVLSCSEPLS